MSRSLRWLIILLVATIWIGTLFTTAQEVRAQSSGSFLGHIVETGETIESIAARRQTTVAAIIQENQLSTPVHLVPGQLLRIRTGGSEPVAADSPGAAPVAPAAVPLSPEGIPLWELDLEGERWIDINLTEQTLTAYVGDVAIRTFVVSTGGTGHETVTGSFRIWAKVSRQDMSGGSRAAGNYYYVPNVPWVQYFYADYSIHGADWHNDFGWPVSHGCVNMRVEEARWLFEWAAPEINETMVENGTWHFPSRGGARVEVHY
jgi:lipoprotein-anchoring transpeptidase ErfK/SrfK